MNNNLITQSEYASRRGISPSAVCQAIKAGRITTVDGKIDPESANNEWESNTNHGQMLNALSKRMEPLIESKLSNNDHSPNDYIKWKARRERAEALRAEQNQELEAGNLYVKASADRAAKTMARLLRDQLLAIPSRLAAQLAGISDPAIIERHITSEIRKALESVERFTKGLNND